MRLPLRFVTSTLSPAATADFRQLASDLESRRWILQPTRSTPDDSYWRRVVALRLKGGEASVAAAHAAMLHCGARGYLKSHRAQRRLRESYFSPSSLRHQAARKMLQAPELAPDFAPEF